MDTELFAEENLSQAPPPAEAAPQEAAPQEAAPVEPAVQKPAEAAPAEAALQEAALQEATFQETALVEAVLYLEANPASEDDLARITGLGKDVVRGALENLRERYSEPQSGIELLYTSGGAAALSPKREYWEQLKGRYGKKNEMKVSRAAIETLSIIAYSQPVTRAEIEKIRGVPADSMIRLLMEKSLIKEAGKKDVPGKPALYATTKDFLKLFSLNSIADLPKLSESDIEKFELEGES